MVLFCFFLIGTTMVMKGALLTSLLAPACVPLRHANVSPGERYALGLAVEPAASGLVGLTTVPRLPVR